MVCSVARLTGGRSRLGDCFSGVRNNVGVSREDPASQPELRLTFGRSSTAVGLWGGADGATSSFPLGDIGPTRKPSVFVFGYEYW